MCGILTSWLAGVWEDSAGKSAYLQPWWPSFDPCDPHDLKKEENWLLQGFFCPPHKYSLVCALTNTIHTMHAQWTNDQICKNETPQNLVDFLK